MWLDSTEAWPVPRWLLQFAEWLVINDGRPDNFLDEYETDPERAWAAAEARGWVETVEPNREAPRRLGDKMPRPMPRVTGEGHLKVEEVRELRKNSRARERACREGMLIWLADAGQERPPWNRSRRRMRFSITARRSRSRRCTPPSNSFSRWT